MQPTNHNAVWITGVGTANPLAATYAETARALLDGVSAIRRVERFDVSRTGCTIAGLVHKVPVPVGFTDQEFAKLERMDQCLLWCATEALRDAGLWDSRQHLRVGIVMGIGGEWLRLWEANKLAGGNHLHDPAQDGPTAVRVLRNRLGVTGPVCTVAAACASANYAFAEAKRWLQFGWIDVCLAGAADWTVSPLGLASFSNLRALSTRNDEPQKASRPFDKNRDGFVMSEGGAIFVLESEEHAKRRRAEPYAELAGCGASSDAFHLVIPGNDPVPSARAISDSLANAGLNPADVDYVNAHATSTPVGDPGEVRAIKLALGVDAERIPVSSTKGATGHLVCAAAAIEAIACLAAIEHQAVPPTINLDELDPECAGLCHVPNQSQQRPVRVALSNSFGFGGSNTCAVFRKVP